MGFDPALKSKGVFAAERS